MRFDQFQFPFAGRSPETVTVSLLNGTAVLRPIHQEMARTSSAELLSLMLTTDSLQNKKQFWMLYRNGRPRHASVLGQLVARDRDLDVITNCNLLFISKKQIAAISEEVAVFAESKFADTDSLTFYAYPFDEFEFEVTRLSDEQLEGLETALREAIKRRLRYSCRFTFKRNRTSLALQDAARTNIHSYRINTGISPPEVDQHSTSDRSISPGENHVPVHRRTDGGHFLGPPQERRARKRRKESRTAIRHSARSNKARGLPDCRARTHRQTAEHRSTHLLLSYRWPVVGDVPMAVRSSCQYQA
ncbi:hypothetical protein [Bradyrhizobium archetypum]|uniref:Uncharacterized protein n=1 Tax=Bradyrhizobium archetypum TaxID=2721160 RepID=A0A7Y4GZC3_9BRAD|nr:hypothetical protein [Bradyrhizobium archetypum]NOJ44781.1 hypothetical protein [Bradyrhizobium archetypum]